MKTYRKVLKVKSVVESDTGVLTCRGINGFGSASVRVELLVSGRSRGGRRPLDQLFFFSKIETYDTNVCENNSILLG
jgi:hypothetical protein